MITCTLTRPTRSSILNPITTCDRRLSYIDDIDISDLVGPKPKTITLTPLARRLRSRSKKNATPLVNQNLGQSLKQSSSQGALDLPNSSTPPPRESQTTPLFSSTRDPTATSTPPPLERRNTNPIAELGSIQSDADPPGSPGPSENSFDSSNGTTSQISQSARTNDSNGRVKSVHILTAPQDMKPITTTISVGASGYLRGDIIDVYVSIDHTKLIKSLHGVIATFYRQARVDYHPALPIITGNNKDYKNKKPLRGISFSQGGQCHMFRKNLDQNFASIIINPKTMKTDIRTSLAVPENAFPTISTVPGAMITFKYYVEVICDLQGKLSGYDKYLPTPGVSSLGAFRNNGNVALNNGAHTGFHGWTFIDTEEIKREKTVIHTNFEIVIGSRDSSRSGKWNAAHSGTLLEDEEPRHTHSASNGTSSSSAGEGGSRQGRSHSAHHPHQNGTSSSTHINNGEAVASSSSALQNPTVTFLDRPLPPVPQTSSPPPHFDSYNPPIPSYDQHTSSIPIPQLPDESTLTEKERIRLAESRLLPSEPPGAASSSSAENHAPSAPTMEHLTPLHPSNAPHVLLHHYHPSPNSMHNDAGPSAPAYVPRENGEPFHHPISEDKQELERRRLESLRSEPPPMAPAADTTAGAEQAGPSAPSAPPITNGGHDEYAPTAPVLSGEEVYLGYRHDPPPPHHGHGEDLPRYER